MTDSAASKMFCTDCIEKLKDFLKDNHCIIEAWKRDDTGVMYALAEIIGDMANE